jgi:signal peptidase I
VTQQPAQSSPETLESSPNEPENPWVEALKTIGLSVFLAFGIRTFVAEARYIPSESMLPALEVNDRLIIEKLGYRFGEAPQPGDVIVFNPTPALTSRDFHDAMIKRTIAVPGDEVELRDGSVWVNGNQLVEPYVGTRADLKETLPPSEVRDRTFADGRQKTSDNVCATGEVPYLEEPVIVPPDSYLVMGDNRQHSYDSRCWGTVPRDRIIGRAVWRFWPPSRIGVLDQE